ncbi:MAG: MliC family protein [Lautropia sp.]|nr:MliC family protein [Lautropia sp.]
MSHRCAKHRNQKSLLSGHVAAGLTTLGLSLMLVACQSLPAPHQDSMPPQRGIQTADQAPATAAARPAVTKVEGSGAQSVVTESLNCVPTKEAQALGLSRTERVVAAYHIPGAEEAGEASVRLTMGGKTYTLREAPAASGARYIVGDGLVAGHKGFSWHTKRNEAIISSLVSGGGVDSVVDGPLLYRCMSVISPDAKP